MHLLRLLNHAAWDELEPVLILARRGGTYEPNLDRQIRRVHLLPWFIRSSTASLLLSVWPLRHQLNKLNPQVVCSFLNHTTAVAASVLKKKETKFLVGIQNNPTRDLDLGPSARARWLKIKIIAGFHRANRFVALSHGVAADFGRLFPEYAGITSVIYNAGFDIQAVRSGEDLVTDVALPSTGKLIVSCGRLTPQKNQAVLLRALALVRQRVPVRLWILGSGPLRAKLEALARELGVLDAVTFLGFQSNPFKYISKANALVLSSDWEGFGNVVVEAMALGIPVVSTECPFGPPEIVTHGENGLLTPVGDPVALGNAIVSVCSNRDLSDRLRCGGLRRAAEFRAEYIAAQYESLLSDMVADTNSVERQYTLRT
jgi:glycosyltransferase involved in cell wall biosynthesis